MKIKKVEHISDALVSSLATLYNLNIWLDFLIDFEQNLA